MAIKDAALIDKNFSIPDGINKEGLRFYDARELDVYGLSYVDGLFRRMPEDAAKSVSENTFIISTESAGGRVKFKTNSKRIAIYAEYKSVSRVPNYSMTATMGFDIYSGKRFVGVFVPPLSTQESLESEIILPFSDGVCREYTIYFPVCAEIKRLLVGIDESAEMSGAEEYSVKTPVVFYGSSITQGSCASHPANTYENILCRELDIDYINLGFWGNALGEEAMARYIAKLPSSLFVYDYDYNAPNAAHLEATHERMFKIIREENKNLPIIIMTAVIPYPKDEDIKRCEVIRKTYENAIAAGDKNVYFLSGADILADVRDSALADNIHPSDIGFCAMADALAPIIKRVLNL
ncbi:MAG: hypothetical protein J6Q69_04865 [Clostridia bacterium]|nr:hypothetical protein [Clostridia bacterium]